MIEKAVNTRLIGCFCQASALTFIAILAVEGVVVAQPTDSSPIAEVDLSSWLKQTELSIRSSETEGIDDDASAWVLRLEAEGGPENPQLAEVLSLQLAARAREGLEAAPQTLAIAERLVALLEKLGRRDPFLVTALLRLGSALSTRGEFSKAVAPLEQAVELAKELDETSAAYGTALSHLAWNYRLLDQLDRAEATALRSLSVREALGPDGDGERSWNFGQLASIALARGAIDRALEYNSACLELREKTMGADALWTGDACEMQGWILTEHGEYSEADEFFFRALKIFETIVGPASQRVARVLNDLGGSATYQARNDDARRLYERALTIQRELYGEDSPMVAQVLHNLGNVLAELGDDEGAIDRQEEALVMLERCGNGKSADAIRARVAIAILLMREDRRDDARTIAERALSDAHASSGPGSSQTFAARLVLAELNVRAGESAEAFALVDSAVTASAKGMGTDHPLHAQALHERARLERDRGQFSNARADADSARSIRRRILGNQHPNTVRSTLLVAELEIDRGRPEIGLALALAAEKASREHALSLFDGFAERQALRYARERPNGLSVATRAWLEAPEKCADQTESFWNAVADSRQLVLRTMAARASKARILPSAAQKKLSEARGRLARLVMASIHSDGESQSTEQLRLAIAEKERAEREVGDEIDRKDSFLVNDARCDMGSAGELLPERSALVAFRRMRVSGSSARYFAFLAESGRPSVRLLDLGPAPSIEDAVEDWVEELSGGELRVDRSPRASRLACRKAGERLRRIVWDPIRHSVPNSRMLFLVPDGRLREVEWSALPIDADHYLVEVEPAIRILLSERDATQESPPTSTIGSILSVGAVDYTGLGGGTNRRSGVAALPASGEEAEMVARVWDGAEVTLLRGHDANEMRVRSELEKAQLIHLGTHAFYLEETRAAGALDRSPLLRAGLMLAKTEPVAGNGPPETDGMLTAEEICALDLSRSQVIVMAACSTGRGVALPGEGTLGLSWALRVAGARGIVLTGWDVDDSDARTWMETFHETLRNGAPLDDAVRRARLAALEGRRRQGLSTHPYHWAAFRSIEGGI
jgi:CHAT domain-containing protein/tetratricopeptide (TPR) repeat protein